MRRRGDLLPALGFLAPNLSGFLVFLAGPLVWSLILCFTNKSLVQTIPLRWTGLENFAEVLGDRNFWRYLLNTLYLMLGMPVAIAGSLALALLLNRELRGMVVYRTLFYLPSFTSGVALMILWKLLYNPEFGAINGSIDWLCRHSGLDSLLTWLGGQPVKPPNWLGSPHNLAALDKEVPGFDRGQFGLGARDALIIMGIWVGIGGGNMLLYLAALSNVPKELVEAAQIDGAGRWQVFRHVTWPQLAPTTFFIVIMSTIGALQGGFDQARVMTGGGPGGTTTTLAYDIYVKGFQEFRIGYASTISWILFAFVFAVTLVYWRYGSRETNE
jgi:multiple sugar transport system permease protein